MAKTKEKELFQITQDELTMKIRLFGDILSNSVFQQIVELMKVNRESENPKSVRFIVSSSTMLISVRYAFPSQFYDSAEIEIPERKGKKEVLKDAAGM